MSFDGLRICGVSDAMGAEQTCAFARGNPTRIGWYLTGLLPGFSEADAVLAYNAAWQSWVDVCGIEPVQYQRSSEAMADVSSGKLHGIVVIGAGGIDGPSGTLAWSELPCGSRRCTQKYDTGEAWIVWLQPGQPPASKIDLVRVACHEIGHAIGISHISEGNLLQPMYSRQIAAPQAGDIHEAQKRYGKPVARPTPPPVTPLPKPNGGLVGNLGNLLELLGKIKPILDLLQSPEFQAVLAAVLKIFGNKQAIGKADMQALAAELQATADQMT